MSFAYEHHFTPLHPLTEEERGALQVMATINFDTRADHKLMVRLLGTSSSIDVIAVTIPTVARDAPERLKWMTQIVETAITALRLSGDPETQPLFVEEGFFNCMYESDDPEPTCPITFQYHRHPEYKVNVGSILGIWGAIANKRVNSIAALLAEAQVPSLPPHYAVLSLIRAIELLWPDAGLRTAALDSRQEEFAALGISTRLFRNALPEIRSRCAHGQGRGEAAPYFGIGYNNTNLRPLKRLLGSIVVAGLKELHGVE